MNALVLSVLAGLIVLEIAALTKRFAPLVIRGWVRVLPPNQQRRYEEEWLRHLEDLSGGPIQAVLWIMGCVFAALRIGLRARWPHLKASLKEARHLQQIQRNALRGILAQAAEKAHKEVCGTNSWRCSKPHTVRAKVNWKALRWVIGRILWSIGTVTTVLRPQTGIERAVNRLLNVPDHSAPDPVERLL